MAAVPHFVQGAAARGRAPDGVAPGGPLDADLRAYLRGFTLALAAVALGALLLPLLVYLAAGA